MGVFKKSKLLHGNPSLIPLIGEKIAENFKNDGYETTVIDLIAGGKEVSITKGGMFKAIIGMKTALKIKLVPKDNRIQFDAGVGIFGLQAIPTAITLFVTWPVIATQILGLIQQSKLDNKALDIAEREIYNASNDNYLQEQHVYCPHDGKRIPADSEYCPYCGTKIKSL